MKALIAVLFTIFSSNLSHAGTSCGALFESSQVAPSLSIREKRFEGLENIRDRLEAFSIQQIPIKTVVKMSFPELKVDLLHQILMLKSAVANLSGPDSFSKLLAIVHINNLQTSTLKTITLESHYFDSLKTLMLLDFLVKEREYFQVRFNTLQKMRLEKFITKGKFNETDMARSFPKIKPFFMEWSFAIHDNTNSRFRIPIFSTIEPNIPELNRLISNSYSFIGLIDHTANPDNIGTMAPLSFANHDVTHIALARRHEKDWENLMSPNQRKRLMIEVRKNYLIEREKLDPRAKQSLDILYFDFLHEDTNVLPTFMKVLKAKNGKFSQDYNLDHQNVLNSAEVHGLYISAKTVYKSEIPESNLDTTSVETLTQTLKPTWYLLTKIWLNAYNTTLK